MAALTAMWKDTSSAARRALFVTSGLAALCLMLQIVNSAEHYGLDRRFGMRPRDVAGLVDIVPASFLHFSWEHFAGNCVFLLVFGFLGAYQGLRNFAVVTGVVMVTSFVHWWLFGPEGTFAVGASGVIWGWIGYGFVRGLFHRKELAPELAVVLAPLYAVAALDLIFPGPNDWRAHLGGLFGGLACGVALRNAGGPLPAKAGVSPRSGLSTHSAKLEACSKNSNST